MKYSENDTPPQPVEYNTVYGCAEYILLDDNKDNPSKNVQYNSGALEVFLYQG